MVNFCVLNNKIIAFSCCNKEVLAYIVGEKHSLAVHNTILIRPGKTQDLPGVRYKVIRGARDSKGPLRSSSRSKYGTKKNK